ncbi:hypothetical protein [Rhizobium sp. PAMB 3182]
MSYPWDRHHLQSPFGQNMQTDVDASSIWLHVGAHRTGSTRLQSAIDENAAKISDFGISVFTPPRANKRNSKTFRSLVRRARRVSETSFPIKKYFRRRKAKSFSQEFFRSNLSKYLISDENMLGDIFNEHRNGFYYEAEDILTEIKRHLPAPVQKVFLAIRPYDEFLTSSYAMSAIYRPASRPQPPFEDLKSKILNLERGWPELVMDIKAVFPDAELHVWTCQNTPLSLQLAIMLGEELATQLATEEHSLVNAAPTEEAIDYARINGGRQGYDPDATLMRFREGKKFAPLTESEENILRSRYNADVEKLEKNTQIIFWSGNHQFRA